MKNIQCSILWMKLDILHSILKIGYLAGENVLNYRNSASGNIQFEVYSIGLSEKKGAQWLPLYTELIDQNA